jgi:phosphoribosyl 1,2-cyclic phosphodiesterase
MEIKTIGSSSSGNCYRLKSNDKTLILECGIPVSKIKQSLNFSVSSASGCLVSHGHL